MVLPESRCIGVQEPTQVGEARRAVAMLSNELEFDDVRAGRAAIVVTELAKNLVAHVKHGGKIVLQVVEGRGIEGLQILALDTGPGMADVTKCLRDGYSMGGRVERVLEPSSARQISWSSTRHWMSGRQCRPLSGPNRSPRTPARGR